jgi:hypothetical protein
VQRKEMHFLTAAQVEALAEVIAALRGGPLRGSKFVPGRFKPAIGAANDALAQLDSSGRPDPIPEELRL